MMWPRSASGHTSADADSSGAEPHRDRLSSEMIGVRWRAGHALMVRLVVLQFVVLQLVATVTQPHVYHSNGNDLRLYYNVGLWVREGRLPYRDFQLEYPPLSVIAFIGPHLLFEKPPSYDGFVFLFLLQAGLLTTTIALLLVWLAQHWQPQRPLPPVLLAFVLMLGITAPVLPWRFDLLPALLSLLAVVAVIAGRPALAGVAIGLGIAAKLYPVVLLPILFLYYLVQKQYRLLVSLLVSSMAVVIASLAPFLRGNLETVFSFLIYHQLRGLQLESVPAGVIMLSHVLGKTKVPLKFNYGALHLNAPIASATLAWWTFVPAVAFGLLFGACLFSFQYEWRERGAISTGGLLRFVMTTLLVFIATNKVFSPQYLAWLIPFVPLLRGPQVAVAAAIGAVTMYLFPFNYADLMDMKLHSVVLLNIRNILVITLAGWLLAEQLSPLRDAWRRGLPTGRRRPPGAPTHG